MTRLDVVAHSSSRAAVVGEHSPRASSFASAARAPARPPSSMSRGAALARLARDAARLGRGASSSSSSSWGAQSMTSAGQARPIHWSPYDRVRVVNADP